MNTVPCLRLDVATIEKQDAVILLSLDSEGSGVPVALSGTGREVYKMIDGTKSVAEIVKTLAGRYKESVSAISDDVCALLDALVKNLIVTTDESYTVSSI